jgi:hypothetical protein
MMITVLDTITIGESIEMDANNKEHENEFLRNLIDEVPAWWC